MIEKIKKSGYKLTSARKALVRYIKKRKGVFSANEIITALPDIDRVSVYRTLDLLTELDLIHPVLNQHGETHYEKHGENHHHHVVCTGCEKTSCIDCNLRTQKVKGFKNLHHSFVITGLCMTCTSNA